MFAPALGREGRSEILECLSLLQCVSSRVLDCYCFWYFGAYHSFCLVDVYFKSLALQCLLPVTKTVLLPVSVFSANARSSAYSMSHGTSLPICSDTASITIMKSSGLSPLKGNCMYSEVHNILLEIIPCISPASISLKEA